MPTLTDTGQDASKKHVKKWRFVKPSILKEAHERKCGCSYCKSGKLGLVLPKSKTATAWRSIRWRWAEKLHIIRWTLPTFSKW